MATVILLNAISSTVTMPAQFKSSVVAQGILSVLQSPVVITFTPQQR